MPAEKVAADLGYASPELLYKRLAPLFPVCEVCGATPVQPEHCAQPAAKKRKARSASDGTVVRLPPTWETRLLFEEVLGLPDDNILRPTLYGCLSRLADLEEDLHGKRFVSTKVDRPLEGFEPMRREDYSVEEWQEICQDLDLNPRFTDTITSEDIPGAHRPDWAPLGARRIPAEELVVLIAVYVLTRKQNLDPLIAKLHPDPESMDRQQLRSATDALHLAAEHVATLVRGGTVGKGRPTEELSSNEASLAYWIADLKEQGLSYSEIREQLKEYGYDVSQEEVERLGKFCLPRPRPDD
jgi:hypothetical protein